jgi:hypothetical protein
MKVGYNAETIDNMKWDDVKELARSFNIPIAYTKEQGLQDINSVTDADDLSEQQIKDIRLWGKKVKGFDHDVADRQRLLEMAQERAALQIPDHYTRIRKKYQREGGDLKAFDDAFRILQGYPYKSIRGAGRLARWTNFVGRLIGGAQISRAFIPNMPQTLALVPGYVGTGRYARAVKAYHTQREEVFKRANEAGAADRGTRLRSIEPGNVPEDLASRITDIMTRVSFLKWFTDKNNLISAEAFRYMAEDWRSDGIHPEEMDLARKLRLSKQEIQDINDGEMSDHTFNKIIQQGVAQTQFYTEAAHRKGLVEINPILKNVFPYQNYAMGTMKATFKTFKETYDAWKSGDKVRMMTTTRRLISMVARYAGTGMIAAWLRDLLMPRQTPEEEEADESLFDQALDGLFEVQFLGPTMRTLQIWKGNYSGVGDFALQASPKVEALFKLMNIGLSPVLVPLKGESLFGRYRKFPPSAQAAEWVKANYGEFNSLLRWYNKFAFPEREKYYDAAQTKTFWKRKYLKKKIREAKTSEEQRRWENELADQKRYVNVPINPDYDAVYQAAQRGDYATAFQAARNYYETELKARRDLDEARRRLRSSLSQRAPIDLGTEETVRFLRFLKPERRKQIVKTHLNYMKIVNTVAPLKGDYR